MMARSRMTMRCTVLRRSGDVTDDLGHQSGGSYAPWLAGVACWVWYQSGRELVLDQSVAVVEGWKALLPRGLDLREHDRIADVEDRRHNVLFGGLRFDVETAAARPGYILAELTSVAGGV